jgi:hypothetical protein
MERLWSLAGATSGNRWQMRRSRKRLKKAETVAGGCDRLPLNLDGKEGVDGSSPAGAGARMARRLDRRRRGGGLSGDYVDGAAGETTALCAEPRRAMLIAVTQTRRAIWGNHRTAGRSSNAATKPSQAVQAGST